jgi:hypothetical protein
MYTALDKEKKSFTLIHCYDILKKEDKWAARRVHLANLEKQQKNKEKNSKKRNKTSSPRGEESPIQEVAIDVDDEPAEPIKKAVGIKKTKQNLRRGDKKIDRLFHSIS